jgi:AcrR family transcriptional regulator
VSICLFIREASRIAERVPRTKEIDDQTLLDACREVFLREGISVSTRRLAQGVGVSEGVLFQRFHTKDELFLACMRLAPPALDDALARALERKSVEAGLMVLGTAALEYLRAQMPVVLLVLAHPKHRDGTWSTRDGHRLLDDARTLHAPFERLLAAHAKTGAVTARQRAAIVGLLVSVLLARAMHEQLRVDDPTDEAHWLEHTIAALGRGFTPR